MPEPKGLSRRRFLSGVASTAATRCVPLSGGAILAACETGEDSAWTHYKHVIDSDISGASRSLVEKQWEKVKEAIAHLQHLQGELSEQKPD